MSRCPWKDLFLLLPSYVVHLELAVELPHWEGRAQLHRKVRGLISLPCDTGSQRVCALKEGDGGLSTQGLQGKGSSLGLCRLNKSRKPSGPQAANWGSLLPQSRSQRQRLPGDLTQLKHRWSLQTTGGSSEFVAGATTGSLNRPSASTQEVGQM